MRCYVLFLLLVFPALTSCDFVLAEPVTKRWISYGKIGVQVTQRSSVYGGKLYWLSKDGNRFRDALCNGIFDAKNNTLVFPLALKRGGNLKALREGNDQYVEIEINFDSEVLVGKWRKGTNRPFDTATFRPYQE